MELVILIGLQASGKSTFRRQRFDHTHVVVSKDHFPNNRRPSRRQEHLIRDALESGKAVVVDNTNPRLEDRQPLIGLAREFGVRAIGYFMPSRLEHSLARNAARQGRERVPDVGLYSTAKLMRVPSWAEGFDELYQVTLESDGTFVVHSLPISPYEY